MNPRQSSSPANPRPEHPAEAPPAEPTPIVERPDGYYWIGDGELGEFGPFDTYELARADRDVGTEEPLAAPATPQQAEREVGIADWIDPETGEPAEGGSPPHLQSE